MSEDIVGGCGFEYIARDPSLDYARVNAVTIIVLIKSEQEVYMIGCVGSHVNPQTVFVRHSRYIERASVLTNCLGLLSLTRFYSPDYLIDNLFGFVDDLLYNFLNLFLMSIIRLARSLSLERCQLKVSTLVAQPLCNLFTPPAPLIQHLATGFHYSLVGRTLFGHVLFIEDLGVVAQVLADLGLLFLGEKSRRSWTPQELLETFDSFFAE
jgi:hypothetical protein